MFNIKNRIGTILPGALKIRWNERTRGCVDIFVGQLCSSRARQTTEFRFQRFARVYILSDALIKQ